MLTEKQVREFKKVLQARFAQLSEEVRLGLLESDEERYTDLAGLVHDREDESVADLLVDVQLASIDRDLGELRDVDAALLRLAAGNYGVCVDCEDEISAERLEANPAAKRCRSCQSRHEQQSEGRAKPSL